MSFVYYQLLLCFKLQIEFPHTHVTIQLKNIVNTNDDYCDKNDLLSDTEKFSICNIFCVAFIIHIVDKMVPKVHQWHSKVVNHLK